MHQPPRQISQAKDAPVAAAVPGGWLVSLQTTQWQHMTELTDAHMGHFELLTQAACSVTSGDLKKKTASLLTLWLIFKLFPHWSCTGF